MRHDVPIKRYTAAVICLHQGQLLTVRLEDPTTKVQQLYLPGGKIEYGETPQQAAIRETLEETSYHVQITGHEPIIFSQMVRWDAQLFDRTTEIFSAAVVSHTGQAVQDAPYHRGVVWLPHANIRKEFAHMVGLADEIEKILRTP